MIGVTCERCSQVVIGGIEMRGQHRPMKLGAPLQDSRDEGDAETAALIAKQISQTRSLVVLILRKIRISQLTGRDEQERNPKSLQHSRQRFTFVICRKIKAREIPHSDA